MKEYKIFWIGYDGVNGSGKDDEYYVMTKKPSGISGGGSQQSIKVVEYRALQASESARVELENIIKREVVPDIKDKEIAELETRCRELEKDRDGRISTTITERKMHTELADGYIDRITVLETELVKQIRGEK